MFSFLTGPTTAPAPATAAPEAPTTRVVVTGGGSVCPEDPKYADLVLLPSRKNDEDFLIQVGKKKGGGGGGGGKQHVSNCSNKKKSGCGGSEESAENFDVVTASAFDMVDVSGDKKKGAKGGKVPRYINKTTIDQQVGGIGARCASGEWVVVSPKKLAQTQ